MAQMATCRFSSNRATLPALYRAAFALHTHPVSTSRYFLYDWRRGPPPPEATQGCVHGRSDVAADKRGVYATNAGKMHSDASGCLQDGTLLPLTQEW